MIDQYVFNEMNNVAISVRALELPEQFSKYTNITLVCDDTYMVYYLAAGLAIVRSKFNPELDEYFPQVNLVLEDGITDRKYLNYIDQHFGNINYYNSLKEYKNHVGFEKADMFYYFSNLKNAKYDKPEVRDAKLKNLDAWLSNAAISDESSFIIGTVLPDIEVLPDGVCGISEREYEVLFANKPAGSREKMVIDIEDVTRRYVEQIDIKATRFDNIIGPQIFEMDTHIIDELVLEMKNKKSITVDENDHRDYYSAVYITQACISMLCVGVYGRRGNIYNISTWHFTRFEAAYHLYTLFSHLNLQFNTNNHAVEECCHTYRVLNPKKILLICDNQNKIAKRLSLPLRVALHRVALSILEDKENYTTQKLNVYYGKIDKIRQLELDTLVEVDKICRENNIKYFLAGGTMLGAVRHNGFIPWDDDVDIAMLPEEYAKFLKVCPQNLSIEHAYQTTDLEPTSLYIHDKIRLKGTFFSTKYSDQFLMENGVYIDVFIYYKTSDKPKKQEKHIRQIHIMRRLLGMRWVNYPRPGLHYKLSKFCLPFMRLFSTKTFKHWYIKLISKYEKKNTNSLIDATGLNLEKVLAFPREWFDDIIYADFEGHKLPILARYNDYLSHWYGERYMDLLPVSSRISVHDVIRIDLGSYVIPDGDKIPNLHQVDLRGELYEKRG